MRTDILKALIENSTLLVVSFLFLTRLSRWKAIRRPAGDILVQGLVFAFCGILAMFFSVEVLPGILIDMRTPIIVVAALTGGPVVGIITVVPLIVYRILIGGAGMLPGLGIILSAFIFGMLLRYAEKSRFGISGIPFQLFTGTGSAAIYLAWILVLPTSFSIYVFSTVAIPLCIASIISIIAIFFIRGREQTHQALLNRLTEINNLYEEISLDENIGIIILQGTRIVYVNQSLLTKYGFSRFDKENSDLLNIVDDRSRLRVKAFLDQEFSTSHSEAVPIEITLNNKRSLCFLMHARKHIYRGRESLLVVSVDISELVKAKKALQYKLDQLQLTLEASGAISWSASVEEDRLMAGTEFFQILAYTPPEEPPRLSHWLMEVSLSDEMQENMYALCSGRLKSTFGEISCTGDDFVTRWFNVAAIASGKPLQISGILFDTTMIKEKELSSMQKEIEDIQSQKMEAIGRLAGGVAHDFNNLLHVIMGYCDILNRVSDNDPVIRDVSEPIVEAAEKGRELVKQLLLFSREKKPELQSVNLSVLTGNFSKLLSRIMEENIVISTKIHCEDCWTFGDSGHIEQVLMNLCVNARDAMPNGGSINIVLDEVSLTVPYKATSGFVNPGNYVTIAVKDSGPGIPESEHRSIFEPFFTTKMPDEGTGLGLSTVLGIVREHSGYIDVINGTEKGLELIIYFPKLKIDPLSSSPPVKPEKPGNSTLSKTTEHVRSICVLLAEDDPRVMNLAIEGLGAAGIRVLRATNGKEAVNIFKSKMDEIQMLVFDVIMPEMNGPEAYKEILSLGGNLPAVFTTGYAGDRLTGIEGMHEVISKPYAMHDLVSAIRRMTNSDIGEK